jgi:hypothetical protein
METVPEQGFHHVISAGKTCLPARASSIQLACSHGLLQFLKAEVREERARGAVFEDEYFKRCAAIHKWVLLSAAHTGQPCMHAAIHCLLSQEAKQANQQAAHM